MPGFFETTPRDPIVYLLSFLDDPRDVLSIQEVCRRLKLVGSDPRLWACLFAEYSGVHIKADEHTFKKFLLYYFFHKGIQNARSKKAPAYFLKVSSLLDELPIATLTEDELGKIDALPTEDASWVFYVKGEMLCRGYNLTVKTLSGLQYLLQAAQLNNSHAMFSLAMIYIDDHSSPFGPMDGPWVGFQPDYEKGKQWLLEACAAKNNRALLFLAKCYQYGDKILEIEENSAERIKLLEQAANNKSASAASEVGRHYLSTAEENIEKLRQAELESPEFKAFQDAWLAVTFFEEKVEIPDNSERVKLLHSRIRKELEKPIFWFEKAMRLGNVEAHLDLANLYFDLEKNYKISRTQNDVDNGLECLKQAVKLKSSEAAYQLGCIYVGGRSHFGNDFESIGVEINIDDAIKWLTEGVKIKDRRYSEECATALVEIYSTRKFGLEPDLKKVFYWCRRGTDFGTKCGIALGRLYLYGNKILGLEKNSIHAEEAFNKAFIHYGPNYPSGSIAHSIAKIYYEKSGEDYYLRQFIKWAMRGIKHRDRECGKELKNFFENKNEKLFKRFKEILNGSDQSFSHSEMLEIPSMDAIELAKKCYEAVKIINVTEDPFLTSYKTEKELREERQQTELRL